MNPLLSLAVTCMAATSTPADSLPSEYPQHIPDQSMAILNSRRDIHDFSSNMEWRDDTQTIMVMHQQQPARIPGEFKPILRCAASMDCIGSFYETPFWFLNKQYGSMIPYNESMAENCGMGRSRLGVFKDLDEHTQFSWGFGADLSIVSYSLPGDEANPGRVRTKEKYIFRNAYAEARYRSLNLMVGIKEIPGWVSDPELASGNLLYGANARPIPQVRAGIFDYADLWGCNGWLAVKGYLAYGFFTDNNWVKGWITPETDHYALNTLYNSKGFMWRIGNPERHPLDFEWGLDIATQFGGDVYQKGQPELKMPRGWRSWLHALFPIGADASTPMEEQLNFEGNTLGTWNFALNWRACKDLDLKLYYEHFFEDHSMLTFDYPWKDGLWGLQLKMPRNRVVDDFVYEFLYSKDQSGAVYWDQTPSIPEQVSGRDMYYFHYLYNGWQNYGMTIGNPFFLSPVYDKDHTYMFQSTRVIAHHFGFKGEPFKFLDYKVLASWQRSWGTYFVPYDEVKKEFSLLTEFKFHFEHPALEGLNFLLSFGLDRGDLIGNRFGFQLGFSYGFQLFKQRYM